MLERRDAKERGRVGDRSATKTVPGKVGTAQPRLRPSSAGTRISASSERNRPFSLGI